ncbi:MAG: ABC transporter ATP-binding protein [Actinomycetota bacterium]|nr:ABC transporter ATP-binding protein [Actinomycetota bacterium]
MSTVDDPSTASPPREGAKRFAALHVEGLTVDIRTEHGSFRAVDGVTFEVRPGEVVGLVGESGSGKSITALALMQLLPEQAAVTAGIVRLGETDLLGVRGEELRSLRGRRVSMVFQDPLTSLNPLMTVERQLVEAVRLHHHRASRSEAVDRVGALLRTVGFGDPDRVLRSYPHELSGGMRQRVMIVMTMVNSPDLLIADEPTTALDVTTQAQVLDALAVARDAAGSAMILISHDLGLIGERCDRVHVMYNGRIIESGSTAAILEQPAHPYTIGLLASRPTLKRRRRLVPIPGAPPGQFEVLSGCAFTPRCARTRGRQLCADEAPQMTAVTGGSTTAACHFASETPVPVTISESSEDAVEEMVADGELPKRPPTGPPLLEVGHLVKEFGRRGGFFSRRSQGVRALDDVSFGIAAGRTLALVGESGSGKSTAARSVLQLVEPTSGSVAFDGRDLTGARGRALREFRMSAQLVQQDPYSALNPRMTVGNAIGEPLRVHRAMNARQVEQRVGDLLESVGLRPEHSRRFPHEFSGGQRQRICIARALSLEPRLLVLDEPVSSLDVSVQAQILSLLADIQLERQIAFLFITHDLAVVRNVADEIAVLHRGAVVEFGPAETVLSHPSHDYTRTLIAAVPDSSRRRAGSGAGVQASRE